MTFEFLRKNEFNTTTQSVVDAVNTSTVENAFDRDKGTQWETVGYGTNTSTIFSIEFGTATSLNRIFLQNHNLKQFRAFYNSATANTFSVPISETTNSDTANFYSFDTITVNSLQIQVDLAQTVDTEKKIGEIYAGSLMLSIERNPSAGDYKPLNVRKDVIHKMPNGGVTQFIIDTKFKAQLKWKFLTPSFTSQLQNIYDTGTAFVFVPFPTSTSWGGVGEEVVWTNDFDFRHSSNNPDAGFGGKIVLEETA